MRIRKILFLMSDDAHVRIYEEGVSKSKDSTCLPVEFVSV